MFKTINQGDVKITLKLSENGTVNLQTAMKVDYPGIPEQFRSQYPDAEDGIGTIDQQFEFVAAGRHLDEVYKSRQIGDVEQLREDGELMRELSNYRAGRGEHRSGRDILNRIAAALGKTVPADDF